MIAPIIYFLCAVTSWTCAALLLRAYFTGRNRLLLWSGAAFCAFGVANILLFVDFVVLPDVDLSMLRNAVTLAGICLLLWGLIRESAP